jgi:hypothetical protein
MMKRLTVALLLSCVVLLGLGQLIGQAIGAYNINKGLPEAYSWACAEGCSNMQEIFYNVSGFNIDDKGNQSLHNDCFQRCWNEYNRVIK